MSSPESPRRSPWDRGSEAPGSGVPDSRSSDPRITPSGTSSSDAGAPVGSTGATAASAPGGTSSSGPETRSAGTAPAEPRATTAPPAAGTAPARRGRVLPRPRVLPLSLLLLAATALGCVGLGSALSGLWWLPPVAATVVTVLLVTSAARWLRLPSALVTVLGLAALLLALTVVHLHGSALLGFVPTSGTFTAAAELWRASADFVGSNAAPYGRDPGLAFVLCALVGLVTVFMETVLVGLRLAGLACLGVLALLLVPALTLPGSVSAVGLAAASLAALGLLAGSRVWGATRDRRTAPAPGGVPRALVVLAGVLAVVLLVPSVIPGFYNGAFPQGSSLTAPRASGVGPLRAVGQDLRSADHTRRFSYTTSDGHAQYMRLLTLSDFSQDEWFPDTQDLDGDLSRLADAAHAAVPHGTEVTSKVTFDDYTEHWLPAPYAPSAVAGLGDDGWGFDPHDLSVHSAAAGMSGASYTVTSTTPQVTADALRRAPSAASDDALAPYLKLPADRPQSVADAARRFTDGARTDYDRALALQNHLRKEFHYDVNAPLAQGYDAGGAASLEKFMSTRAGYSGHFAPAMALMAREMGIPARVAVGYLPTTAGTDAQGATSFPVGTGDSHAWPELYFEGVGWVRFEPTPGIAAAPDYAPENAPDGTGQNGSGGASATASPSAGASGTPSTSPSGSPSEPSSTAPATPSGSPSSGQPAPPEDRNAAAAVPWWAVAGVLALALVLLLAALPRWLRGRRRGARVRAMQDASLPAQRRANAAWGEFCALAEDYGATSRPSDTPRVRARRLSAGIPAAHPAVERILSDLETASYGAPDAQWHPRAAPEDLARVRDEFRHRASRGQQWRATWWPASLRRHTHR
ncbi:DUF3488 and transglutaminase-like domain-containing protein [Kocuria sp.]|uniref:transglutaminase family protein n=1 Tax=Kocuria sp. TaxID=1871328 RepID=UPI0026DD866D|nr:DUF3488 and transglutaminase-like domain-containing protein [Kocuria sp.]MDO4919620.1 DUF3488 and transglutaminase-like domain-containing protein [Kocuria sp.]